MQKKNKKKQKEEITVWDRKNREKDRRTKGENEDHSKERYRSEEEVIRVQQILEKWSNWDRAFAFA